VSADDRETIVIAGARGFVGRALLAELAGDAHIIGLSRSEQPPSDGPAGVEWRGCDLYSVQELERALAGADRAIYLVHSMQPSARLVQGNFSDLDLLLADNFVRVADAVGVKQIVYVGGLLPKEAEASPHLRSRAEVAETLGSRRPKLSALRAGIIVGEGGPSLWILLNLVRRLPIMVLPSWTQSRSQPIALVDVVRAVKRCLAEPERFEGHFDVGGPDVLSYRELMQRTARVLGRRIYTFQVDLFTPVLSTWWVQGFGSAPATLVAPLVRSLRHDLVADSNPLQDEIVRDALPFDEALALSLGDGRVPREPSSSIRMPQRDRTALLEARRVRSVQRLPLPEGRDAEWAADEYLRFLPIFWRRIVRVEPIGDDRHAFRLWPLRKPLLVLRRARDRSTPDRQVFDIVDGILLSQGDRGRGRFEFREVLGGTALIAAIHDYRPALPWRLYQTSQALVHLWVMKSFGRHLARARNALDSGPGDRRTIEAGPAPVAGSNAGRG
jgi:uncharacterized protein YbjT (DUF2867 family)